jgi:hypothetical protein
LNFHSLPPPEIRAAYEAIETRDNKISNYEMLEHFDPDYYGAVVLDESSIIKHFEGKFRNLIAVLLGPGRKSDAGDNALKLNARQDE